MLRWAAPVATSATLSLAVAGCGGDVAVTAPNPAPPADAQCRTLIGNLPDKVSGQDTRSVTPSDALAGAWGDPAIVLRCGVVKPAGLQPTSSCAEIDNVGWFADKRSSDWLFTTIGRSTYVQVSVPNSYQPASDALVDLAPVIKRFTKLVHPCR
ncbi:MAG: DUF3515 domain-containing protein [Nocardioidaceae bacterium]